MCFAAEGFWRNGEHRAGRCECDFTLSVRPAASLRDGSVNKEEEETVGIPRNEQSHDWD